MKRVITILLAALAPAFLAPPSASSQTSESPASADDVVRNMIRHDAERKSEMTGYTAVRRYAAVNRNRRAEMVVRVSTSHDGTKQFTIMSEAGSSAIRKHVFYRILSEEGNASRRETRDSTRITPANYTFKLVGRETLDSGPAYVLLVVPKADDKYLINGKIWIDAKDYSIVRIEGQPAHNPSFWVHDVHFVHTYQRVGQFWLASSTDTTSEVRIFGRSELTITDSDYALNAPEKGTQIADSAVSAVR